VAVADPVVLTYMSCGHCKPCRPAVLRQAIDALANCGICGIVGAPALGTEASFDVNNVLTTGKTIRGIVAGDSVPDLVIPSLVELYLQGRFPFDRLVKYYTLDQINQAAEDSEKGVTIKPIVRLGSSTPAKLTLLEAQLMEGEIQRPETLNSPVTETSARNGAWR